MTGKEISGRSLGLCCIQRQQFPDVNRLGLKSEEQIHHQWKDPTEQFLEWDDDLVSEEERNFLKGRFSYSAGERGG